MAAGFVAGIGLLSKVLGIINFGISNMPSQQQQSTQIQVKAGLGIGLKGNSGGSISNIYGYDANNHYVGQSGDGSMDTGGETTLKITADQEEGVQTTFLDIVNDNDAICYAWLAVTQPDGIHNSWTGDVGKACGQNWYYSNQQAGTYKNGSAYEPACTWLDGDHSNGIPSVAMKMDLTKYAPSTKHPDLDQDTLCGATIFTNETGKLSDKPTKRSDETPTDISRPDNLANTLIISGKRHHSAKELCHSETSFGPDMADVHGMYCDMDTKTLSPMCTISDIPGCVKIDEYSKHVHEKPALTSRVVGSTGVVFKRGYDEIARW